MNVEDFFELVGLDTDEIETEVTTFSGWCNEKLERFAKKDDSFDFKNITVIIKKADEFTVERAKVIINKVEEEDEE